MSSITKNLKREGRKLISLWQALSTKVQAGLGSRGPSRTCQVPGLRSLVAEYLPATSRGIFVEVGAYDGERFSNTSWLADNGWQGFYIEPSSEFARLCQLRHCLNRVQVINLAAGASEGTATLKQIGSLSTMSGETFEEYQHIPWAKGQIDNKLEEHSAHIRPLNDILQSAGCPESIDILVVDVEGFEESVFQGFDLDRWHPRMIIVELCDVHADFSGNATLVASARRVRQHLHDAGYIEVYRDEINTVFVRSRNEHVTVQALRAA